MDVRFDTRRSLASLVEDMPVTVAVDARGESVHVIGLQEWSARIRTLDIPVRVA
jgi:fumarate hydratase class I